MGPEDPAEEDEKDLIIKRQKEKGPFQGEGHKRSLARREEAACGKQ